MKINVMLEIDETDKRGLEILEELEVAAQMDEGIRVRTAGTGFTAKVLTIEEV